MHTDNTAKLLLRVGLGLLLLLHGIAKMTGGIDWLGGMISNAGLPSFFAYGVYIGEVVAPIMLILGYYTRSAAIIIIFNMIVAIALVHGNQLLMLTDNGGWKLELQAFFMLTAAAIALLGSGKYALRRTTNALD